MRPKVFVLCAAFGALIAAPALADCVDFSPARAKAEQAAAKRAPLTPTQLGVPTLAGLERDIALIGDPKCGGLTAKGPKARFKIVGGYDAFVAAMYPNIKRRTTVDGMKREWFANPFHGDSLFLTSGTELDFIGGRTVDGKTTYSDVMIIPAAAIGALTTDSQPYSLDDVISGTPWPGGAKGKREFVRADGGASGYQSASAPNASSSTAPTSTATTPAQQACAPKTTNDAAGSNAGRAVGAEVGGAVLGGGYGRSVGAAAGSILGGLGKKKPKDQPAQAQLPPCP
jgi:hypothetical protein